jgi:hypothetical protein
MLKNFQTKYPPKKSLRLLGTYNFNYPSIYSPAFSIKSASEKTIDLRSTIYWQPNVITNVQWQANFSFFSADTPGSYTIIIQGSDVVGNIGYKLEKINIK